MPTSRLADSSLQAFICKRLKRSRTNGFTERLTYCPDYAPTLFVNIGQSEGMALILSGVFNCLQLVGVILAFLLIDRVGRRPLAIFGSMGMTTCYVIIAGLVGIYAGNWSNNTSAGWACVAMAFLFIIIYGASYSPLGWALPPEIFPISLRSKGVALSVSVNWLSNFIV